MFLQYLLVVIAGWGKKYRGDFIAGWIAFLVPFLITLAIKGLLDPVAVSSLTGLIFISVILILSNENIFFWLVKWWRRAKFNSPITIGILDGDLHSTQSGKLPPSPFTDYQPKEWFDELSSIEGFDVYWASVTEISDKFDVIVNPFGELYPEVDKANLITLRQIAEFVKKGGVFMNVAGLAFYYVWDGKKQDLSGPLFETYKIDPKTLVLHRIVSTKSVHLRDCSLFQYFGIRTTMFGPTILSVEPVSDDFFNHLDGVGGKKQVKEFRSAYRSENAAATLIPLLKASHNLVSIVQDEKGKTVSTKQVDFDCYPIAAVNYGKGYLLLNGMALEKSRPVDFQKALEAIKCVAKKLNSEGFL